MKCQEREPAAYEIRQVRMADGEMLHLIADTETGLPDGFVARHMFVNLRSAGASSGTIRAKLIGIRFGLTMLRNEGIDIETRIASGRNLDDEELHRLAQRCTARADGSGRVTGDVAAFRYASFIDYYVFRTGEVLQYARQEDHAAISGAMSAFEKRARRRRPRPTRSSDRNERLGLEPHVRELLLRVITPGDPGNPFQRCLQVRNHAMILLAYVHGLRSGESLALKRRDYDDQGDHATITIHRRPDDVDDTRRDPALVKTFGRMLPIDGALRDAIDRWLHERKDRARYPNVARNPYLFVNRDGGQITLRRCRQLYELLRNTHPELGRFVQHVLRHDANDRWTEFDEEHGRDADQSRRERTVAFGWSDTSTMPELYSKAATRRSTQKRLLQVQRETMEEDGGQLPDGNHRLD